MPAAFKRYPIACDGTLQTIYTCPASTETIVIGFRLANKDGVNTAYVDVYIDNSGTDYNYSGQDTPIPPGSALNVLGGDKVVLNATDKIEVQAAAAGDIDGYISVLELT